MSRVFTRVSTFILAAAVVSIAVPQIASAGGYPTNGCVSKKQKAVAKYCQSLLKAYSKYHANPDADPTDTINKATSKLESLWSKAEEKAAKKNADCVETTVTTSQLESSVGDALDLLQQSFDNGDANDRKCRSKILGAAGKLCSGLLKAESKYIKNLAKDPEEQRLDDLKTKFTDKFQAAYDKAAPRCSSPIPTSGDVLDAVSSVNDETVTNTTTSPNYPSTFQDIFPPSEVAYGHETLTPSCSRDEPYVFFARRGTVNKLLMYYQGGGACWSATTCNTVGTFKNVATVGDNPGLTTTGFAALDNPDNPFRNWNVVFVSYCTGDVHWGDTTGNYTGGLIRHYGRINAKVAEKFAREHFVNPEMVFVTGSSAGAYGAIFNSTFLMHDVYPASKFRVLGDAGAGVITQQWLESSFPNWDVQNTLPKFIPDLQVPVDTLSMPDIYADIANYFPQHVFGQYQSTYDGSGGGQAGFYNVMKHPNDVLSWGNWWAEDCEWSACMHEFVGNIQARAPSNFRYYTGAGSRHTIYGSDKIYEDTTGGVPTFVDWIDQFIAADPLPASVDCADGGDCNLVNTCQGGSNLGLSCATNADCPGGECELDPTPPSLPTPPYYPGGVVSCPVTTCPCLSEPGGFVPCD